MRRSLVRFAPLALALAGRPGCFYDLGSWDTGGDDTAIGFDGAYNELEATDATMNGEVGGVELSGESRIQSAYGWSDYVYIDLRANGRRGAAMNAITIEGGLEALEVGEELHFDGDDRYGSASTYVSVLGCAGPSDGNWDFDRSADQVTVQVEPGPTEDTVQLQYTAYWGRASNTGTVVVPRQGATAY